jgi:repressor LexA
MEFRNGRGRGEVPKWETPEVPQIDAGSPFIRYNAPMAITRRQKEVLDFISGFVQRNGYSPSFEEIARGLDLRSLATVHKHITNLQSKGLLARAHNRSRSIDVLPPRSKGRPIDRLPLMGRIAAGYPVETVETPESISLGDIVGNREVFALQVRGESMRDEHIVDGDFVLVEKTNTARSGEIVVALVRGSSPSSSLPRRSPSRDASSACSASIESNGLVGLAFSALRYPPDSSSAPTSPIDCISFSALLVRTTPGLSL